ncbi:MAG: 3'(2'),5'-bisphosphate nucleotidase CysQ [Planctomycetota bacterium]|nr:3'(2'),5'-bisphosphate nucleotidase CysQ [Planctomycetota bacterium]
MTTSEFERDVALAVEIAEVAGERALMLRETKRWTEPGMLADIGDQAADGLIQGFMRGRLPEDGILSEETADSARRQGIDRVWIVDPLDGTREYSQLREDWAVHVALTIRGKCAVGVLVLPARGKTIWGVCHDGARSFGLRGAGTLATGDSPTPTRPRIVMSRSHTPSWMPRFAEILDAEMVRSGSVGNKVGMLLLGEADLYAHRKGLNEWDTCAPECVARAMGWSVSNLRGAELKYNQPDPRLDEFMVCKPAMRERVLAALRESGAVKD